VTGNGTVGFRPEAARLGESGVRAVVRGCRFLGSKAELEVGADEGSTSLKLWAPAPIAPGTEIHFQVAPDDLMRFPAAG